MTRTLPFVAIFAAFGIGLACPTAPPPPVEDNDPERDLLLEYADAGVPDRPEAQPDAGVVVCFDVPPMEPEELPRCTKATQDCINACAGADGCRDACIAADTFPPSAEAQDCGDCSFRQIFSCLDRDGCHPEVAATMCCLLDCNGDQTCIQTECTVTFQALFVCGISVAPQCFDDNNGDPSLCYDDV